MIYPRGPRVQAAHILAQAGGAKLVAARDVEGQTAPQLATEKGHKSLGAFLANLQVSALPLSPFVTLTSLNSLTSQRNSKATQT